LSADIPDIELCEADDATFWPWFNWTEFANWPHKPETLVVIPIAGMADWGLGHSLDAEETVLMAVLKAASLCLGHDKRLLVTPPIRFAVGPMDGCAFAIDPDVACDLLEEVGVSIGNAGFTKVTFFNASPWTEEVCKAVGRDLRIAHKLQMFCVHLSALGLDFHPKRGGDRAALKTALGALSLDPEDKDGAEGRTLVTRAAARLAALFLEMRNRAPLANGGILPTQTWP